MESYLKSDTVGVDVVVLRANNARLRVTKLADIGVQYAYVESRDEIAADVLLGGIWLRLAEQTSTVYSPTKRKEMKCKCFQ